MIPEWQSERLAGLEGRVSALESMTWRQEKLLHRAAKIIARLSGVPEEDIVRAGDEWRQVMRDAGFDADLYFPEDKK